MEIELLAKKIKNIRKHQRLKKMALKLFLLAILLLSGLMIILSLYNLSLGVNNKKLLKRSELIKQKIVEQKEVESQQVYLLSKLDAFKALIKVQAKHQEIAEAIFNLVPDGTSLKGFDVNESGSIMLSGSVPNWQKLSLLINKIKQVSSAKLRVLKAEVKKISFGNKGEINFDISLQLSEN